MKAYSRNQVLVYILVASAILVLFTPLYMYFSHDAESLQREYPHRIIEREEVRYVIKEAKPDYWVSLKNISTFATWAIVLSEDWSFYEHEGVDIEQLKVALSEMYTERRFRGASTITQQMIKNVFLSEDRSLIRKLHELILAQKVEKVLSKERILEIYLNCIEYGPGIYGIKDASRHYFKKHPSQIGPKEGAFLAMLLPSPKRYYVSFQRKKLTKFAETRVNSILAKMRMGKIISRQRFNEEKDSKLGWEK